jgi:hydrogenase maturation protease
VTEPGPLLVLGVGNVFYGDEGAGVHLVHHLRGKYAFPPHVTVMDGGTLGWQLLHHIAEYDRVVLVDAVAAPPGKVYCFGRHDVPDEIGYGKLSSHEWEVPDLLTAMDLYGDLPEVTIVAIGVDPLGFAGGDVGVRLSPPILARMEALATVVLREVARYGGESEVRRPEERADRPIGAEEIVLAHA